MLALDDQAAPARHPHLRPVDARRDLNGIADLIETCFAATMDPDGKEYLRHLRRMARDASFLRWASGLMEKGGLPFNGFVWEESGRLVGNLSLIQLARNLQRIYLIANVAVAPDYRRQGIAREMTQAALDYAATHDAWSAWLQVRTDNPGAVELYQSLGFQERARRTTWVSRPDPFTLLPVDHVRVTPRLSSDWPLQRAWLRQVYPPEVAWNLPINIEQYRPSLWNFIQSIFNGQTYRHWVARQHGQPVGVLTWQLSTSQADHLWLATLPDRASQAVLALVPHARRHLGKRRTLSLNLPAGLASDTLKAVGFVEHQTLMWMEVPLRSSLSRNESPSST